MVLALHVDGVEAEPKEQRTNGYLRLERRPGGRLAAPELWMGHPVFRHALPNAGGWIGVG